MPEYWQMTKEELAALNHGLERRNPEYPHGDPVLTRPGEYTKCRFCGAELRDLGPGHRPRLDCDCQKNGSDEKEEAHGA